MTSRQESSLSLLSYVYISKPLASLKPHFWLAKIWHLNAALLPTARRSMRTVHICSLLLLQRKGREMENQTGQYTMRDSFQYEVTHPCPCSGIIFGPTQSTSYTILTEGASSYLVSARSSNPLFKTNITMFSKPFSLVQYS